MTTTKTQFNQSEAARIVGRARNTIAAHIKDGKLTLTEDAQGNRVIDHSELIRVYGDQCDFDRVNPKPEHNAKEHPATAQSNAQPGGQPAHAQLRMTEQMLEAQKEERSRERERLEAEIERLEKMLARSEERQNKITLLLEDRTRGIGAWEKSFQTLERRVEDQEEVLRKKHRKAQQQAHHFKEAYEAEKSKSLWKKLFG